MRYFKKIVPFLFLVLICTGGVAPLIASAQPATPPPAPAADAPNGGNKGAAAFGDASKVFGPVMSTIMIFFAALTGYAGIVLNDAVYFTVLRMGEYVNGLAAVGVVWSIMRDIGNIVLIFGFLAIGICTILGVGWYGGGTKMLPILLVAAIFLNFSLFVSKAVIDVGNIFATQFYTQINGGIPPAPISTTGTVTLLPGGSNTRISNIIMQRLGLQALYDINKTPIAQSGMEMRTMMIGFLGVILFIVTAFVMFSLAFILIARFVVLIFLMMIAPIGFAGLAVPKLSEYAKKWWNELIKQTLTAPILLLMLYVALSVISDDNFVSGFTTNPRHQVDMSAGYQTLHTTGSLGDFASILLSFIVAMGLLLACTMLAKNMGATGATFATKWASRLSGAAIVAGGVGFAGRRTVGALGSGSAKLLRSTSFGRSFVGRGIASSIEKRVAGASFDMRNTGVASKAASAFGFDLGKGQKGGYTQDAKDKKAAYVKAGDAVKGRAHTEEENDALAQSKANREYAAEQQTEAEKEKIAAEKERDANHKDLDEQKKKAAELDAEKKADPAIVAAETSIAESLKKIAALEEEKKKDPAKWERDSAFKGGPADQLTAAKATMAGEETARNNAKAAWEAKPANAPRRAAVDKAVTESAARLKTSQDALAAATKKFNEASTHHAERTKQDVATKEKIGTQEDRKKEAQRAYAKRLKEKWGMWDSVAKEAGKSVEKNIGKSADEREWESFMAAAKKAAAKGEHGEDGGHEEKPKAAKSEPKQADHT